MGGCVRALQKRCAIGARWRCGAEVALGGARQRCGEGREAALLCDFKEQSD